MSLFQNNLMLLVLSGIGSCVISVYMIPVIIHISHAKYLLDQPFGRKLHNSPTPNLGGIALFGSLVFVFLISGFAIGLWASYLLAGLILLFFSGLKDDILTISAGEKLLLQLAAIGLLIFGGKIVITNFGGMFGLHAVPYGVGAAVTFFTMVVVLNAYNLIDGIDGLAGGIGLMASLFFSFWFYRAGLMGQAVLSFVLAGSLVGFLFYNFHPASIFMGDTGSQIVGYLLGFFAVSFVQHGVQADQPVLFQNEVPVLVLAVLIVPLYDTLRVFAIRVIKGYSPFKADRRHVHHQLIDCGFSQRTACFIIYGFNLLIMGLVMILAGTNINILLAVVMCAAVILFPTARFKRNLLKKLGVNIPSAERIKIIDNKIMFGPPREVSQPQEEESKKVAV